MGSGEHLHPLGGRLTPHLDRAAVPAQGDGPVPGQGVGEGGIQDRLPDGAGPDEIVRGGDGAEADGKQSLGIDRQFRCSWR